MSGSNPSVPDRRVRIIHLEDNPLDQELVAELLAENGLSCEMVHAHDRVAFQAALENEAADLIISDYSIPSYDGGRALELATYLRKEVPFIFFSGTLGEEAAIESLKNGATDYVLKQRPHRLVVAVRRALEEAEARVKRRRMREELRQRDTLLRKIMEGIDDLVTVVDLEGRVQLSSPSHRKLFGEDSPKVGDDFLALAHPDDRVRIRGVFQRTIDEDVSHRVEYRVVLPGGGVRFIEAQGSVMHDEDGRIEFVLWASRDVTERKAAEEQIREQAALLDEARDAICVNDLDQHILFWNKSAERLYGWTRSEALGRNANELLYHGGVAITAVKTLIQRGEWHGELRQTTQSGAHLVVESRWALIRDAAGAPKSILVINTDITKRKQAEQKVREQAALLDKARDAILVCDLDQRIDYWNEGATRLYGWAPEQAIGQPAETLLFRQLPQEWPSIRRAVDERGEWIGELHQITQGGKEVVVQCRQTLVRDAGGRPTSVLYINSDITEKKQIEAQFLRTQRMESIGALAGGIAHDLNNVLGPIMMAVEVIQSDPRNPSNASLLELVGASAKRGSDLVKQILSFARGVSGEKVSMSLRPIVADIAKLAGDTFPRDITLHTILPDDLPDILGDATQVHQILLNLCVNARDAMPHGGTLRIEAVRKVLRDRRTAFQTEPLSGSFIELKVADTGTGISAEAKEKIFEPFFTTKELGKGTGLGLSTVLSIVRGHGGFVEVESEPGEGATFLIYLPATAEAVAAHPVDVDTTLPHGRGETILIVDDEAALLEITRVTLDAFGYRVLTAQSGAEANAIFAQRSARIDLVLTDMMLPALNGRPLISELRTIAPTVRIIAVSSLAPESSVNPLWLTGIKQFLKKPYTTATLLTTIRSALDA